MRIAEMGELLLDVYACATDETRWSVVLDGVRRRLGVRCAAIQCFTRRGDALSLEWLARDSASEADPAHHDPYVSGVDSPRVNGPSRRRNQPAPGLFTRDRDLFEPGNPQLARLHECLADIGLGFFLSASMPMGPGEHLVLALHRDVDDTRDFGADDEAFLAALLPHLSQSAALAQRLAAERAAHSDLQAAADHLRCGLILCGHDSRLHWLNEAATRLVAKRECLSMRGGRLTAGSAKETAALRAAIALAADGGGASGSVTKQCVLLGARAPAATLQVLIVPLKPERGRVMLLLGKPGTSPVLPTETLARLYSLTPAESRLATALCQGLSVSEYALAHRLSVGTARFQLKQVLAKTQTARQSDLLRELCMSVAARL